MRRKQPELPAWAQLKDTRPHMTAGEMIAFLEKLDPSTFVDVQFYACGSVQLDRFSPDSLIYDEFNERVVILAEYN